MLTLAIPGEKKIPSRSVAILFLKHLMHGLGLEKELSYILSLKLFEPPSSRHSRPVLNH